MTPQLSAVPVLTEFYRTTEEVGQYKGYKLKARLPYAKKIAESLMNEATSLTSMVQSRLQGMESQMT